MSKFCTPKKRSTFRRQPLVQGNRVHLIGYPNPATLWTLIRNKQKAMKSVNNAVLKEKAS